MVTGVRGLCTGLGPAIFGIIFTLFGIDKVLDDVEKVPVVPDSSNASDVGTTGELTNDSILPGPPFLFGGCSGKPNTQNQVRIMILKLSLRSFSWRCFRRKRRPASEENEAAVARQKTATQSRSAHYSNKTFSIKKASQDYEYKKSSINTNHLKQKINSVFSFSVAPLL